MLATSPVIDFPNLSQKDARVKIRDLCEQHAIKHHARWMKSFDGIDALADDEKEELAGLFILTDDCDFEPLTDGICHDQIMGMLSKHLRGGSKGKSLLRALRVSAVSYFSAAIQDHLERAWAEYRAELGIKSEHQINFQNWNNHRR